MGQADREVTSCARAAAVSRRAISMASSSVRPARLLAAASIVRTDSTVLTPASSNARSTTSVIVWPRRAATCLSALYRSSLSVIVVRGMIVNLQMRGCICILAHRRVLVAARAPNAAGVQDRGDLYGTDVTKNDREIQRQVMRGALPAGDPPGSALPGSRLREPRP